MYITSFFCLSVRSRSSIVGCFCLPDNWFIFYGEKNVKFLCIFCTRYSCSLVVLLYRVFSIFSTNVLIIIYLSISSSCLKPVLIAIAIATIIIYLCFLIFVRCFEWDHGRWDQVFISIYSFCYSQLTSSVIALGPVVILQVVYCGVLVHDMRVLRVA